ncbi:ketoacid CoA transferase [Pseudomonas aeruginosa]|uniref:CoA-transferase subunit beta n=1 Tax=Pseudomonas aeruginosa TaxID=287 RepID=UPI001F27E6EF|nr:ketoacid CoA transferase [Pseudomonas aeruginosa]MDG3711684.1 ketoacid CoA transferase [Pseudomonas aeruginosa]
MTDATDIYSLAELLICAASDCWADDGEVLATGIGVIPRLAASLAMLTCNLDLLMTDSEAFMVAEPVPLGPRGTCRAKFDSWMGFSRIFDNVWGGRRHALVGPTQIDRFGQANISCIGDYARPKVQMLGVRGLPGNSISHANSFFVPTHNRRVFVEGEVDMVSSVGYNPARLARGWTFDDIDIRRVITDLCVLDFDGPGRQARVRSLHPGVSLEQVLDNTGFDLHLPPAIPATVTPSARQLALIRALDPHDLRSRQLKDNPPGIPAAGVRS